MERCAKQLYVKSKLTIFSVILGIYRVIINEFIYVKAYRFCLKTPYDIKHMSKVVYDWDNFDFRLSKWPNHLGNICHANSLLRLRGSGKDINLCINASLLLSIFIYIDNIGSTQTAITVAREVACFYYNVIYYTYIT